MEINDLDQPTDKNVGDALNTLARRLLTYDAGKDEDWSNDDWFEAIINFIENDVSKIPPIKMLEDILSHYKAKRKELKVKLIPDLMKEAGVTEAVTKSGISIKLDRELQVESLSEMTEERKKELFKWVEEKGGKALLKDTLKLGKGEFDSKLKSFLTLGGYNYESESGIHPQTLKKFLKEIRDEGKEIPENIIKIDLFDIAKIKE
jgi:hypothetical protein